MTIWIIQNNTKKMKTERKNSVRKIIAMIEIDEEKMDEIQKRNGADYIGPIDYLHQEFGWLNESGIYLEQAKILDDDDQEDVKAIEYAKKVFND